MTETQHWADKQAQKILDEREDKEEFTFNSGMSISGKMHIGNLRGELITPSRIKRILEDEGKKVNFKGVYYTQDRFKGKEGQLNEFEDPEKAREYIGMRLIDVPDPKGCHDNWVEHYNSENHPYLEKFGVHNHPITTTEFYKMNEAKELVKKFLRNREKAREVINRFRKRNPHPPSWIPFEPLCSECGRIDKTEAIDINLDKEKVKYECGSCGSGGWSSLENGKLTWRLEWSALWHVLDVDFETYGKDHATPGGSRDSCIEICKEFDLNYPSGFAYNWVYLKKEGKPKVMTSSGNVGINAQEYLEIANPDILNYLYISTKPMKEIYFDPEELPIHYRHFDKAEKIYFGEEEAKTEKRSENIKRNYELAVNEVPEEKPQRVPYSFCSTIAQVAEGGEKRKQILKRTGHLENPSEKDLELALKRIELAGNWIEEYEPERHTYEIKEEPPELEINEEILEVYRKAAEKIEEGFNGKEVQQFIYETAKDNELPLGEVFKAGYRLILGEDRGPRLGPFLASLDKDFVVKRLREGPKQ